MDEYRKMVIDQVRSHPLLWDPDDIDYKNQDKRKVVWMDIDSSIHHPLGVKNKAKQTWEHLAKGYANALRRKDKRLKNVNRPVGVEDKGWRFEKDMTFLIPAKKTRTTLLTGNFSSELIVKADNDSDNAGMDGMCDDDDQDDLVDSDASINLDEAFNGNAINNCEAAFVNNCEAAFATLEDGGHERSARNGSNVSTSTLHFERHQRPQRKLSEPEKAGISHRLAFFTSLMPVVNDLTEDEFLDFQMDVIQNLKKFRAARAQLSTSLPT